MSTQLTTRIKQKGFTLLELTLAVGISSFIVLATLSLTSAALVSIQSSTSVSALAADTNLLSHFFFSELQNTGGYDLPPASAFYVENNCAASPPRGFPACAQSDRLTVAFSKGAHTCTITAYDAVSNIATLNSPTPGVCCFSAPSDFLNQHIVITDMTYYIQRWVSAADSTSCQITLTPGPMAGNDYVTGAPATWIASGSYPVLVELETFYWNSSTKELDLFSYYPSHRYPSVASTSATSGANQTLAVQIYDLQFALGFDFSPADGLITDTPTTVATNEWLYNKTGQSRTDAHFINASPSSLKMMEVAWIMGTMSSGTTESSQILNGPQRTAANQILRSSFLKIGFRSTDTFY